MLKYYRLLLALSLVCLCGCLSFTVGGRNEQPPTMAQEITELRKLRERGTITAKEFEMGKLTLLQQYRGEEPVLVNPADTQLATYPAPVDESRK